MIAPVPQGEIDWRYLYEFPPGSIYRGEACGRIIELLEVGFRHQRQLSKDERQMQKSETLLQPAVIRLMVRRVARSIV